MPEVGDLLAEAAATGRGPDRDDLASFREAGARAAEDGIEPRALVAGYLRAVERAWAGLPDVVSAPTVSARRTASGSALAAARRVIDAVLDGYQRAQRLAIDRDEGVRRDFVEELLGGRGDPGRLAERAERFGVLLGGGHVVVVARGPEPCTAEDPVPRRVAAALAARFGSRNALVTTRDGQLVCVTPSTLRGVPGELAHQLVLAAGTGAPRTGAARVGGWQVAVGRPHSGPGGVLRSYIEARDALHLADRLGFRSPVLHAADLLVFPVLLRDRAAIDDLITTVLGPLTGARGGARPLLETLSAFFACQGNSAATARRLGISVRAVGYRLERIQRLTGYTPTEPTQRFTLEAAVLGARLLDWPNRRPSP